MGDLSEHFSTEEFICGCGCRCIGLDPVLFTVLEEIRSSIGDQPILVTSGYRCKTYNRRVGGAKNSQHMRGRAADIDVMGMEPVDLAKVAKTALEKVLHGPCRGGLGIYDSFVHVDVRPDGAWRGDNIKDKQ